MQCVPAPASQAHLGECILFPAEDRWARRVQGVFWGPQLRVQLPSYSCFFSSSLLAGQLFCLHSCSLSVPSLPLHLCCTPVSVSRLSHSLSSCHFLTLSLALRHSLTACLCSLALTPSLFLATAQGRCPCPVPGAACQWAGAPVVRNRKSRPGRGQTAPQFHEGGDVKPERPRQAKAKNFSLTRRPGYLVCVGRAGGSQPGALSLQEAPTHSPPRPEVGPL